MDNVGRIHEGDLLTLEAVQHQLGLSAWAIRKARRQGLRVHYVGRRLFVCGRDLIDFVKGCKQQHQRSLETQQAADPAKNGGLTVTNLNGCNSTRSV